jgi:hypothetical protein
MPSSPQAFPIFNICKGFIHGHSTVCQLLEMYQSVCQNLDERLSTILIFCDISQAFDRACHEGLIKKLKSYGISGDLLIWIKIPLNKNVDQSMTMKCRQ